ncbi:hypothetical protein Y032_0143g2412 [Ancylostoma ceylanicum]|uniref:Uncharacterized protein n=1 Tax=Ancylostoma ceylanicum TaxID=53326 RepID=A0A016T375_9BILA|nr:hypothetical protein Y032_0143g2412 [Ancylostoma ceylanicum]
MYDKDKDSRLAAMRGCGRANKCVTTSSDEGDYARMSSYNNLAPLLTLFKTTIYIFFDPEFLGLRMVFFGNGV